MKNNKDFSLWTSEDVKHWLSTINLKRYIDNFCLNNMTGYDLCYLTTDDFKTLGISNIHDKNTLLKEIRLKTLEQLQIQIKYESKEAFIQLDFDSNFNIYSFASFLNEIFNINTPIAITTESNEILSPNIKLVELLLLNPSKYRTIKIVKDPNEMLFASTGMLYQQKMLFDDIPRIAYDTDTKRNELLKGDINESAYDSEGAYISNNNIKHNHKKQVIPIDETDEVTYGNTSSMSNDENIMFNGDSYNQQQPLTHINQKNNHRNGNHHHSKDLMQIEPINLIQSQHCLLKKYNTLDSKKDHHQPFNYNYKQQLYQGNQGNGSQGMTLNNNNNSLESGRYMS